MAHGRQCFSQEAMRRPGVATLRQQDVDQPTMLVNGPALGSERSQIVCSIAPVAHSSSRIYRVLVSKVASHPVPVANHVR